MRIIIYTGKGGVGKTSLAAATAVKLANQGVKTLVISTDLAHSLSDSFAVELNHRETKIKDNLMAMELNPQFQLENNWDSIYNYLVDFLKVMGIKDIFAEELTMFPGVEELFSLLEIYDHYQEGKYEALILDFPPTASTLRLLSFFDVVGWYMERFFKIKRRGIKVIRTFSDTFMEMPLPEDDVFAAFEEIYQKMALVKDILTDPDTTSVRLVVNPQEMVINESQRAYTYLNLYGFNVDSILVNKVLPAGLNGDFYQRVFNNQQQSLEKIESLFSPLRIFKLPLIDEELKGLASLEKISRVIYDQENPLTCFQQIRSVELKKQGEEYHYSIYMPYLDRDRFNLHQRGGVLILKIGTYKQKIHLPQVLSNKDVKRAKYQDSYLNLFFA